jgi:hypothetical protein
MLLSSTTRSWHPTHGYVHPTFDDAAPAAELATNAGRYRYASWLPDEISECEYSQRAWNGWNERRRWSAGNKFGMNISFSTLLRSLPLARPARTFLSCEI